MILTGSRLCWQRLRFVFSCCLVLYVVKGLGQFEVLRFNSKLSMLVLCDSDEMISICAESCQCQARTCQAKEDCSLGVTS